MRTCVIIRGWPHETKRAKRKQRIAILQLRLFTLFAFLRFFRRYSERSWLENLLVAASCNGYLFPKTIIREGEKRSLTAKASLRSGSTAISRSCCWPSKPFLMLTGQTATGRKDVANDSSRTNKTVVVRSIVTTTSLRFLSVKSCLKTDPTSRRSAWSSASTRRRRTGRRKNGRPTFALVSVFRHACTSRMRSTV